MCSLSGIRLLFLAFWGVAGFVSGWCWMPLPLIDVANRSDLVVLATPVEVSSDRGLFAVTKVYRGRELLDTTVRRIQVSPIDLEQSFWTLPPETQQFVLFLNQNKHDAIFSPTYYRQWLLEVGSRGLDLKTIEHMLETFYHPNERHRVETLVRDLRGADQVLKGYARSSLFYAIRRSQDPLAYKDIILSFLSSDHPESMSIGLSLVDGLRIEEAIPHLIALARHSDPQVVRRVSLALRGANIPEVARTLTELMKHPDPQVRLRAALDTDHINEPEVIQGLVGLAGDPDPQVRAIVPRSFYFHSPDNWRNAFLPVLLQLADDADAKVRANALRALGDNRFWKLIPIDLLIERLKRNESTTEEIRAALESLYVVCSNRPAPGSKIVETHLDTLIGFVMNEQDFMIGQTALLLLSLHPCPKTVAIMERAASEHRFSEVRALAQRLQDNPVGVPDR
jgi:HEAT repeat protein